MPEKTRLPIDRFAFAKQFVTDGTYSDKYFLRAQQILQADQRDPNVLMQIFCRTPGTLCGMDEAIAMLKYGTENFAQLQVHALHDGDHIEAWETVMTIEGPYQQFAHLETVYLGVLARGTRVATQMSQVVATAAGRDVLFFGARHDHPATQVADGYAALIGGAAAVASDAQGKTLNKPGVGTIPHALIAAYDGDSVTAAQKFVDVMPDDVALIALVDFDNDCVGTSLAVAKALGRRLAGVRLDTSASMVDVSLTQEEPPQTGVTPGLVTNVRHALDQAGYDWVNIIVSGGFDATRVAEFVSSGVAVDAFGVGSSILRNYGSHDFTADIVQVNGKAMAKVGRELRPNSRLSLVN